MGKRQAIRARRRRERIRSRLIVVSLVTAGALLITFALALPLIDKSHAATNAASTPVIAITPQTLRVKVDGVHLGDPGAPVKVDVYEDFRCSICRYYTQNIEPQILTNYVETGKVYYTFHTYVVVDSIDGADASYRSANAAMCALEQDRFWDYHDTLFANQITESASLFTDARLTTMAENLGLDMTGFGSCYQVKKYANLVQQDILEAQGLNVTGTPSFFVNGQYFNVQQLVQAIDDALAGN